mmetsp:Transcript_33688/g.57775  ORF Transcript_33688/g.57775 Transcript_33688/m.57775 type:complete len:221 (-) Transcript_33688:113-775(-)
MKSATCARPRQRQPPRQPEPLLPWLCLLQTSNRRFPCLQPDRPMTVACPSSRVLPASLFRLHRCRCHHRRRHARRSQLQQLQPRPQPPLQPFPTPQRLRPRLCLYRSPRGWPAHPSPPWRLPWRLPLPALQPGPPVPPSASSPILYVLVDPNTSGPRLGPSSRLLAVLASLSPPRLSPQRSCQPTRAVCRSRALFPLAPPPSPPQRPHRRSRPSLSSRLR